MVHKIGGVNEGSGYIEGWDGEVLGKRVGRVKRCTEGQGWVGEDAASEEGLGRGLGGYGEGRGGSVGLWRGGG